MLIDNMNINTNFLSKYLTEDIPHIFMFHKINETITTSAQMSDVMKYLLTFKRDEDVLTYLAILYVKHSNLMFATNNTMLWLECALRVHHIVNKSNN